MSVKEAPPIKEEAPVIKTQEQLRIETLERLILQLNTELQNCQTMIATQLGHSQNLNMLIELTNKELSDLVKQQLQ